MTPEELEKLPKPLERTMTALELSIMAEIVERIKATAQITPVIDWLLVRLSAIGESKARIKRLIGEVIKESNLQVDKIYEQAAQSDYVRDKAIYDAVGKDYTPYEDNKWLQQVVDAARRQTKDSLRPFENITQTTGFNVPTGGGKKVFTPLSEYLERSLDKAMMGIVTGTKTYSQAIGDVIDEMTASGVRTVDYASGKSDRIEVAVRRAVMTGMAQMTDKVNERNAQELGTDHWEVDWHMGARNTGTGYLNHQSWQGRVYSSEEMRTVCGLGEMLGFAGINCYHIRHPFIPGVSQRKYTDEWLAEQNRRENEKKVYHGREYDVYGALQHQRKLERTIRKQKQDVELLEKAGADKKDITAAKSRLRLTNKAYVEFSKEMGLRQQRERLKVGDTRKADTQKAEIQKVSEVEKSINSGIMKKKVLDFNEVKNKAREIGADILQNREKLNLKDGNPIFEYVSRRLGYNKLPEIVDSETFKKRAEESPVGIIYRGVFAKTQTEAERFVEAFKTGELFTGRKQAYGHGIYFSPVEEIARKYAQSGGMIKATLHRDAKVVDYLTIMEEYSSTGANTARMRKNTEIWEDMLPTVGEYAAIKGYDAIALNGFNGNDHIIILNRGRVIVEK